MSFQYLSAAKLVDAAEKGKSLKSFCASVDNLKKTDYALAMQTLKYIGVIKEILSEVDDEELNEVNKSLLYVMMYEVLFGKGKIHGGGVVKKRIMLHIEEFQASKNRKMEGKTSYTELLSEQMKEVEDLPIYVRINEAKLSIPDGFEMIKNLYPEATQDDLIPSLIKLPSDSKGVSRHQFIADGLCVLQDKASCFPSQILFNEYQHKQLSISTTISKDLKAAEQTSSQKPTFFIDACSAPGNKTSHLAALLMANDQSPLPTSQPSKAKKNNHEERNFSSSIYAFDKSADRAKLLKRRMQQYAVDKIITVQHQDFMTILTPEDTVASKEQTEHYEQVEYVLLDPSCSGSGIVRNIERVLQNHSHPVEDDEEQAEQDHNRVLKLQAFQIDIIQKAMSLPSVHTMTYSTCSIHQEENEDVVVKVLESEIGQDWELITPKGFESWDRRGKEIPGLSADQASKLIRCLPSDGMNGFFVALFQKKHSARSKPSTASFSRTIPQTDTKNNKTMSKKLPETNVQVSKESTNTTHPELSKQKRSIDKSHGEKAADHEQPGKKQKMESGGAEKKKKVAEKDPAVTSGSIFKSRFTVSKTAKRKFHKRK